MTREEFLNVALLQATEEGIGIHLAKFADICIKWGQQHPHWISVKEKLPKEGEYVATINTVGVKDVRYYSSGKWYSNYGNEYGDITHWLPLPQAPKKGGKQ